MFYLTLIGLSVVIMTMFFYIDNRLRDIYKKINDNEDSFKLK